MARSCYQCSRLSSEVSELKAERRALLSDLEKHQEQSARFLFSSVVTSTSTQIHDCDTSTALHQERDQLREQNIELGSILQQVISSARRRIDGLREYQFQLIEEASQFKNLLQENQEDHSSLLYSLAQLRICLLDVIELPGSDGINANAVDHWRQPLLRIIAEAQERVASLESLLKAEANINVSRKTEIVTLWDRISALTKDLSTVRQETLVQKISPVVEGLSTAISKAEIRWSGELQAVEEHLQRMNRICEEKLLLLHRKESSRASVALLEEGGSGVEKDLKECKASLKKVECLRREDNRRWLQVYHDAQNDLEKAKKSAEEHEQTMRSLKAENERLLQLFSKTSSRLKTSGQASRKEHHVGTTIDESEDSVQLDDLQTDNTFKERPVPKSSHTVSDLRKTEHVVALDEKYDTLKEDNAPIPSDVEKVKEQLVKKENELAEALRKLTVVMSEKQELKKMEAQKEEVANVSEKLKAEVENISIKLKVKMEEEVKRISEKLTAEKEEEVTTALERLNVEKETEIAKMTEKLKTEKEEEVKIISEKLKAEKEDEVANISKRLMAEKEAEIANVLEKLKAKKEEEVKSISEKLMTEKEEEVANISEKLKAEKEVEVANISYKLKVEKDEDVVNISETLTEEKNKEVAQVSEKLKAEKEEQLATLKAEMEEEVATISKKLRMKKAEEIVKLTEKLSMEKKDEVTIISEKLSKEKEEEVGRISEKLRTEKEKEVANISEKLKLAEEEANRNCEKLKENLAEKDEHVKELQQKLIGELEIAKAAANDNENKLKLLADVREKFQQAEHNYTAILSERDDQIEELQGQVADFDRLLADSTSEAEKLRQDLDSRIDSDQQRAAELNELNQKLEKYKQKLHKQKVSINSLTKGMETSKGISKTLQLELSQTKEKLAGLEIAKKEAEDMLATEQQRISTLSAELQELKKDTSTAVLDTPKKTLKKRSRSARALSTPSSQQSSGEGSTPEAASKDEVKPKAPPSTGSGHGTPTKRRRMSSEASLVTPTKARRIPKKISNRVIVMVSSFKGKDRESISENVTKLGGSLREGPVFDCSVSHVIVPTGMRTVKSLAAGIAGKWIMGKEWIDESMKAGHFLPEDDFGKCYPTAEPFVGKKVFMTKAFRRQNKEHKTNVHIFVEKVGRGKLTDLPEEADIVLSHSTDKNIETNGMVLEWSSFLALIPGSNVSLSKQQSPKTPIHKKRKPLEEKDANSPSMPAALKRVTRSQEQSQSPKKSLALHSKKRKRKFGRKS